MTHATHETDATQYVCQITQFAQAGPTAPTLERSDRAITQRPAIVDDRPYLLAVYASTREAELAVVDWDAAQRAAFVEMQFDAQHAYYQEHYDGAAFDVVLVDAQPAGRLYVERQALRATAGRLLRIHVARFNPALRLYQRLGFEQIEDRSVYLFMEWTGD